MARNFIYLLLLLLRLQLIKGWENPNLKYFGFYTYTDNDFEKMPYANLYEHPNLEVLIEAHGHGLMGLWFVQNLFFTNSFALRPDYLDSWNSAATQVAPLIKNGTVLGFMMGDELILNGVTWDNLNLSINLIRESFPDSIIYTNEAWITFKGNYYYPKMPENLDWVSIDYYPGTGTFLELKAIYYDYIFPKMNDRQKVMFVPGVYSTVVNPTAYCGGNPHCEQVMIDWNFETLQWAKTEPRFVGIFPWHFDTFNTTFLPGFEIGLDSLPYLQQAIAHIGTEIITGKPTETSPIISGTICGLNAGTSTSDVQCSGLSANSSCPSGYNQQIWKIAPVGDGYLSFCAISETASDSLPIGGICGMNSGGDTIPCDGFDPLTGCPSGYFQNEWHVDWGTSVMYFCSKSNNSLPDATGTICGMVTNGGSTGVYCGGQNPLQSCPTSYAPASWNVPFGDGVWGACFKI